MRRCGVKRILAALCLCALLLCSCGVSGGGDKITVVATMFPQYDFARNIAGARADVELLLDFGADAHSYEPTPADIIKIARADLFIYTGDEMEIWAKKLLESSDVKKAVERGTLKVLDVSKSVALIPMHDHDHDEFDTHIWTSPANAVKMCEAITGALIEIDAENASVYNSNLNEYKGALKELLASAKALEKGEVFFGGSFAFRYLFDEAGLEHYSIYEGCSSHAEPSAADIAEMVEKIKASGARYVLYDALSEKKIADSIAAECGIEVLHLHAVHNITKAEFDAGEDYVSLMTKNVETLRKALS